MFFIFLAYFSEHLLCAKNCGIFGVLWWTRQTEAWPHKAYVLKQGLANDSALSHWIFLWGPGAKKVFLVVFLFCVVLFNFWRFFLKSKIECFVTHENYMNFNVCKRSAGTQPHTFTYILCFSTLKWQSGIIETETVGPQSLNYFLSGPLLKRFVVPEDRLNRKIRWL